MDGIKLRTTNSNKQVARSVSKPISVVSMKTAMALGNITVKNLKNIKSKKSFVLRIYTGFVAVLILATVLMSAFQPFLKENPHLLSQKAEELIPKRSQKFANVLKESSDKTAFEYNTSYSPNQKSDTMQQNTGSPRITASISKDSSKGITVKDPVSEVNFSLIPKFKTEQAKKSENQLFYRLQKNNGYLVYTTQSTGVKEDIVLQSYKKDKIVYEYEIKVENGLATKLEKDGSIGVYGSELPLNGDVATGSEKDVVLLQKAREKADKTKLLFTIPAPIVKETNKTASQVKIHY